MNAPQWVSWLKQAEQLFDQKQFDEASNLAEQVLRHNPDCAAAHQVLGLVATERGQPQDALARLERALALQPDLVPSHNGLGRCCALLDDLDRALHHFNAALAIQPEHAFAHFNRATVWLKQGRYADGWLEYEWRWNCGLVARPQIPRPRWDGSPLNGRSILVHTEQGLGDVLQFVRFLPGLQRRGGRIVLACQKALQPLLRPLPCVDEWFPVDEPGSINFQLCVPILSLPGLLGVDETNIPTTVPYVPVDRDRCEKWRPRVEDLPGFKIGLAWQGSPTFKGDVHRSIPLRWFAPLGVLPGVSLVSLQKGPGEEQIEPNRAQLPLHVFEGLDRDGAFLDTAALMQYLDLVITSDTAIAHLAGALGRPVWVLLSAGSDWRWLVGRSDSPWYPTMRLFRQKALGDWAGVVAEVAAALQTEIAARRGALAGKSRGELLQVPISAGELIDKITILEIKQQRLPTEAGRANVRHELQLLEAVWQATLPPAAELPALTGELKQINEALWDIEEEIRQCERAGDFGEKFIALARSVYQTNDRRSAVKRQINGLLRSTIREEKSYGSDKEPEP